jgi:hypothetical protein
LSKVTSIASAERHQRSTDDDDPFETSSGEPSSELRELVKAVGNSITWLFKLSMILRNPTHVDRYAKAESIGTYDSEFDIDYVRNKLPYLQWARAEWLIERLGKANTRRREFLSYCEKHRIKLAYVDTALSKDVPDSSESAFTIYPAPNSLTTASTFMERYAFQQTALEIEEFETQSFTSYATSIGNDGEDKLSVPPQPIESLDGKPFECPFCFTIQIVKGERPWK